MPSGWSAQNRGNIASTFKDTCSFSLSWTQDPFCLITMSLGSHTFCLIRAPKSSWILSQSLWFVFLVLRVCFSHPQGGRDEGNYLEDALVKQDAQVSRTAASFFSFANKTRPSWWTPCYSPTYIGQAGICYEKRFPQMIFNSRSFLQRYLGLGGSLGHHFISIPGFQTS